MICKAFQKEETDLRIGFEDFHKLFLGEAKLQQQTGQLDTFAREFAVRRQRQRRRASSMLYSAMRLSVSGR